MRGDRLKAVREHRGLTQPELAERIGIHPQQVYRIESGKSPNPNADTLTAMAKVLEVSVDYLLGLVEDPVGHLREEDLSPDERRFLEAIRNGRVTELLKIIAGISEGVDQASIPPNKETIHS